ncbi:MAG TPA: outer membrane protein assembly factor BamD, partial [Polyangia bacterium]
RGPAAGPPAAGRSADTPAPPAAGLTEENVPIAAALAALARGAPGDAIAALEQHARRFPDGQLAEEREALWIQALVTAGDAASARARAERFRRRFPGGIQQEAVSAALEKIQ